MRINTNTAANTAYRNVESTGNAFQKSIEKLSSGFRINRASDDAAGLSIANRLRQDNRSLQQASRNASQAGSVLSIADGASSTITDILGRMKELAIQSGSDNVTSNDRQKIDAEYQQLFQEIDRTVQNTKYQGSTLLDGNYGVQDSGTGTLTGTMGGVTLVTGSISFSGAQASTTYTLTQSAATAVTMTKGSGAGSVAQTIATSGSAGATQTLNFDKLGVSFAVAGTLGATDLNSKTIITGAASGGTFQVGSDAASDSQVSITLGDLSTGSTGLNLSANLLTRGGAQTAITELDTALGKVNDTIGKIGAAQSRLEFTQSNLASRIQNTSAAESVIRDADMAFEMTQFTKTQVLQQAGQAMLAQANQSAQGVLSLLRG